MARPRLGIPAILSHPRRAEAAGATPDSLRSGRRPWRGRPV